VVARFDKLRAGLKTAPFQTTTKKLGISGDIDGNIPQELKPALIFLPLRHD